VKKFWSPGLGAYLARHPSSGWMLARAGWRLRANGWWRRPPFMPLPDTTYWQFRMTTYGASAATPLAPAVMVDAAKWSLRQPGRR
jgi:hypothetical protein